MFIKPEGIVCGDDLELQSHQVDIDYAILNKDRDFVKDPKYQLKKILNEFLYIDEAKYGGQISTSNINQSSIGKGYKDLNQDQIYHLKIFLNETYIIFVEKVHVRFI